MKINYNLTEDDYLKFNLFHMKNSKSVMRSLNIQRFLTPVFFILISYLFSKIAETPFLFAFIPFFIMSILWIIFYPKFFYKTIIRNVKKMIREGQNGGLIGEHHMIFTKDEITESTSTDETKVKWSGIQAFKEDNDYFYLYNSSVSAYILPKRELTNVDEVKGYIEERLIV
ncbi:YcxB family protein [Oceanobacillus chungangensis]|uniref:YcxB-like C-terminal domain-containing protein n=1 Tax=Oceanobacillus chungangensis TaxID=1229152 RepID=A0A3D8PN35_9BACI|nr:YcxB family protein [Oceanobacillus chungangensis]RDW17394.1 hypothetical protein CWR45_12250 [Oceanobacillus chungangensis]